MSHSEGLWVFLNGISLEGACFVLLGRIESWPFKTEILFLHQGRVKRKPTSEWKHNFKSPLYRRTVVATGIKLARESFCNIISCAPVALVVPELGSIHSGLLFSALASNLLPQHQSQC